jgi:hypothetical protein
MQARRKRGDFNKLIGMQLAKQFAKDFRVADTRVTEDRIQATTLRELINNLAKRNFKFDDDLVVYPEHLAAYIDTVEGTMSDSVDAVEICFHAPPQHNKTTTSMFLLVLASIIWPNHRHAYITYNETRAQYVCAEFKRILKACGIPYSTGLHVKAMGSEFHFTSINGSITGYKINGIALLDDPVKGDDAASSPKQQQSTIKFFNQELATRTHGEKGMSIIVMMTRWDSNDLIGYLHKRGWRYICLQAVADGETDDSGVVLSDPLHRHIGETLYPSKQPLERMLKIKEETPQVFYAMYQGAPTAVGVRQFNPNPCTVSRSQWNPMRAFVTYGIDVAYAGKQSSDYNCAVRLITNLDTGITVIDAVLRMQSQLIPFIEQFRKMQGNKDGGVWFAAAFNEPYLVKDQLLARGIRRLEVTRATISKARRAVEASEAWNANKLCVFDDDTRDSTLQLIEEVSNFTGDPRKKDDCVDALGSAYRPAWQRLKNMETGKITEVPRLNRQMFQPLAGIPVKSSRVIGGFAYGSLNSRISGGNRMI